MSSYLSVPIAGILWFTTGEHSHHQKRWQLFSSLEDELAQGLVFGLMPGCTTAAHGPGELQTQTGSRSTGKDLSPPNWKYLQKRVIHTINISVTFWLTSECPECRKLAAKSPSCCHICGELMPRGTSTVHSLRVYFWRGRPATAACFGSWFESSQIFAGELLYLLGEPCSCSESREAPMAWDPDGIGKPQLSVTLHWLLTLPGSGKKTSHGFLFVCKINKYGSENIFLRLRSMEKSAGKVGTHPDKQQFWYECDCFKSCAQLVCASQVAPLRLISAILFVDLVSGRKFGRNSRYWPQICRFLKNLKQIYLKLSVLLSLILFRPMLFPWVGKWHLKTADGAEKSWKEFVIDITWKRREASVYLC